MAKYIVARSSICTECTEPRARAVVAEMQRMGIDVEYGEKTRFPGIDDPEESAEFGAAFYASMGYQEQGHRWPDRHIADKKEFLLKRYKKALKERLNK